MKHLNLFIVLLLLCATFTAKGQTITGTLTLCDGTETTLTGTPAGGTWSSSAGTVTLVTGTGVVRGISPGTSTISYTAGSGIATVVVTVYPYADPIIGFSAVCEGSTLTLSTTTGGGTWTTSSAAVLTVGLATGLVTGVSEGTATVTYTNSLGCKSETSITVNPVPPPITVASDSVCIGDTAFFTAPGIGSWTIAPMTVASLTATGAIIGISPGVAIVTFEAASTGCRSTVPLTVVSPPTVSVTATPPSCGEIYVGTATGATSYVWTPATGVACTTCATTNINPTATTTYTVIGTTAGCTGAPVTVAVNGNRILGHISFSSSMPSALAMKVWLIQFNPTDSSIVATDSVATCLDGGVPYYQFDSLAAGNYMVKAKLLSSVAGTSDYIPTYGASTPNWYDAASISHAAGTDVQNINMVYSTVPAGPGFITGYVYSGAGKGTSGEAPEVGMLVYLKNPTTGQVITYTYTDGTGAYSFSGLAYGDYMVYPDEFGHYTTPTIITLSAAMPNATGIGFRKSTTLRTISPFALPSSIYKIVKAENAHVFPNPSDGTLNIEWNGKTSGRAIVTITDVAGMIVYKRQLNNTTGNANIDISMLRNGLYFINIKAAEFDCSAKFLMQR